MKNSVLIIIFVSLITCSSWHNNVESVFPMKENIVIDLDLPKSPGFLASNLFKKVKAIILETGEESMIGGIDDIQVFDGQIYILDHFIAKTLFVFSLEGQFVRKIGKHGRGPGEYATISCFTIDTDKKEICLLDGLVLHKYNIDGKYIRSVSLRQNNIHIRYIQYFDKRILADVYSPNMDDHLLWEFNPEDGRVIKSHFKSSEYNCGWNELILSGHNFFASCSNGAPKYTQLFMNKIISLDNMKPYITLKSKDLATFKDLEEIRKKDDFNKATFAASMPKIHNIQHYVECPNFIYFTYQKVFSPYSVLHYFPTNTTHHFSFLKNDLVWKKPRLPMNFMFSDSNGAYEVIRPIGMDLFLEDIENGNLVDNMDKKKQLLTLNEESNPFIFYYEFKDAE